MPHIESVTVIGLGYIGLPTAAILAERGLRVHGTDVNPVTVDAVNAGSVPFVEPDLAGYVMSAVEAGKLTASDKVVEADAYIVAVPTPFADDYRPDLSYIESATMAMAPHLRAGDLVVLESTSPPGATERMGEWIAEARPDLAMEDGGVSVLLAHCPERVLPGRVMVELVENDRIVGGVTPEAAERAQALYAVFCDGEIHLTDARTAELAKLVENSFRDVNIAFANELSLIADRLGVDVWELIALANKHPRVDILQPGPGVGGHCIAVDPWFIVDAAPAEARLIRTAREVNDAKPEWVRAQVRERAGAQAQPTIALLGLAFKPDIDDLRESPACKIAADVAQEFAESRVLVVEPNIESLPAALADAGNVHLRDLSEVAEADVIVLLVDHREFKAADLDELGIDRARVVDTRGIWR